jgi:hypothetical protein
MAWINEFMCSLSPSIGSTRQAPGQLERESPDAVESMSGEVIERVRRYGPTFRVTNISWCFATYEEWLEEGNTVPRCDPSEALFYKVSLD